MFIQNPGTKKGGERKRMKEGGRGRGGVREERHHKTHSYALVHEKSHLFHYLYYKWCFLMLSTKEAAENSFKNSMHKLPVNTIAYRKPKPTKAT